MNSAAPAVMQDVIGGPIDQFAYLEKFAGQRTVIDCRVLVQKSEAEMLQLKHWQDFEVGLEMGLGIESVDLGAVEGWDFGLDPM